MTQKKSRFAYYPSKYAEIAKAVGMGQAAVIRCPTAKLAESVRMEFNTWRSALRKHIASGEGEEHHKPLLKLAEDVVARVNKKDMSVSFEYRDSSKRAQLLEKVEFFPSADALHGGGNGSTEKG